MSWLPLILIIREHDSSIWVVLQSEKQTAAHPILFLSLTDARIRELRIPNSKGMFYALILSMRDRWTVSRGWTI